MKYNRKYVLLFGVLSSDGSDLKLLSPVYRSFLMSDRGFLHSFRFPLKFTSQKYDPSKRQWLLLFCLFTIFFFPPAPSVFPSALQPSTRRASSPSCTCWWRCPNTSERRSDCRTTSPFRWWLSRYVQCNVTLWILQSRSAACSLLTDRRLLPSVSPPTAETRGHPSVETDSGGNNGKHGVSRHCSHTRAGIHAGLRLHYDPLFAANQLGQFLQSAKKKITPRLRGLN